MNQSSGDAIKLFGTEQADPPPHLLNAGALTALFDNGALRRICFSGNEVLRGIAYLPRDKNWGTYAPALTNLSLEQADTGFRISYDVHFADAQQSLSAHARIEGKNDGTLTFSVTATPGTDFITNRTGFVVLHPLKGVVGKPVEVTHTDDRVEVDHFPEQISPGQPIFEIAGLAHRVMPGVTATLTLSGNKFEMEDHRNWMDASYKTYVCSLLDPWPYTLIEGAAFTQSVHLALTGKPRKSASISNGEGIAITVGKPSGHLPAIGLAVGMADAQTALVHSALIAAARPAHLVCQIDGRAPGQAEAAAAYSTLKTRTGCVVTLELILPALATADEEMASLVRALQEGGLSPDSVIVTQAHDLKSFQPGSTRPWGPSYEEMAAAARAQFPGIRIGGGMLSFFTELNRKRPPQGLFDFITHSTCPIVHAADDLSVMETLEALPWIIKSTRALIGKAPYHLGPSGIACRDNPYGAATFPNPGNLRTCLTETDPRQRGLFAAAWTLGLIAGTAAGRLEAITPCTATGPRGLIYAPSATPQPGYDGTGAEVVPAYHVFAALAQSSKARRLSTQSTAPQTVAALAHQSAAGPVLWLANLTAETQTVQIIGNFGPQTLHLLCAENFDAGQSATFLTGAGVRLGRSGLMTLPPYATARLAPELKSQGGFLQADGPPDHILT